MSDRVDKIQLAIDVYEFENPDRIYNCLGCNHKHPAPTNRGCPFAEMLEEEGASGGVGSSDEPEHSDGESDISPAQKAKPTKAKESAAEEETDELKDLTEMEKEDTIKSLKSQVRRLTAKNIKRKEQMEKILTTKAVPDKVTTDDSAAVTQPKKRAKVNPTTKSKISDGDYYLSDSSDDELDVLISSVTKPETASPAMSASEIKAMVWRKANKLIEKNQMKLSGLTRTGSKFLKKGFLWPQQFIHRRDGHRPVYTELNQPELMLGMYRMAKHAQNADKETEAQHLFALYESIIDDLAYFSFEAVLRSVQMILILVEQGQLEWHEHQRIRQERDREMQLAESEMQLNKARTINNKAADVDTGVFLLCLPFQRGECAVRAESHMSTRGRVRHFCAYCYKQLGKKWKHPESLCGKKSAGTPGSSKQQEAATEQC